MQWIPSACWCKGVTLRGLWEKCYSRKRPLAALCSLGTDMSITSAKPQQLWLPTWDPSTRPTYGGLGVLYPGQHRRPGAIPEGGPLTLLGCGKSLAAYICPCPCVEPCTYTVTNPVRLIASPTLMWMEWSPWFVAGARPGRMFIYISLCKVI